MRKNYECYVKYQGHNAYFRGRINKEIYPE